MSVWKLKEKYRPKAHHGDYMQGHKSPGSNSGTNKQKDPRSPKGPRSMPAWVVTWPGGKMRRKKPDEVALS